MEKSGRHLTYRADIDGLRAIAIVAVVAYHAGMPGFGSGYLGVDVFFVISGFLITSLLYAEFRQTGRIDFISFYGRRARRLLPALSMVLLAVTVAGLVLMSPSFELRRLGQQVFSASIFGSNILYWRLGGYFAAPAINLSLLHTWTLAVEEQFYIIWPCLLFIVRFYKKKRQIPALVAAIVLLSLISWSAAFFRPDRFGPLTFYLSPFRAWEFGVGAGVSILPKLTGFRFWVTKAGALSALLICLSLNHVFSPAGLVAVVTVFATGALVADGEGRPADPVSRILSWPPIVGIGLVSYAWYLWHWPILSFVRAITVTDASPVRDGLLSIGALGLAIVTWRYVEQPIRNMNVPAFRTARRALWNGALTMFAGMAMGAVLYLIGSRPVPQGSIVAQVEEARPYWTASEHQCSDLMSEGQNCKFGDSQTENAILLTGDSHAAMVRGGLVDLATDTGEFRLISRTLSSCRPVLSSSPDKSKCQRYNEEVAAEAPDLIRDGMKGVVLAAYWGAPSFENIGDLKAQVQAWRRIGVRVALVAESPVFAHDPRQCLLHRPAAYCGLARPAFEEQRARVMRELRQAAANDIGVKIFELSTPYCNRLRCEVVRDGRLYFFDSHHLSLEGARALSPSMREMVRWLLNDQLSRPSR